MGTRDISDTNLATYLRAKGFREISRPKLIKNAVTFFFEDSPKLTNEIEAFFNQETLVEPISLFETLRVVRSLVFEIKKTMKQGGGSDGN
jgi:hypothetical protein